MSSPALERSKSAPTLLTAAQREMLAHPVGQYLRDVQKSALKGLWEGIQAGLLPGLDDSWFFRTFMPNAQIEAAQMDKNKRGRLMISGLK
ncbi:hypothetical protein OA77_00560 [Pseudomonas coronafaciens]|nr:hypothetical protein OA77_00560 [Pseudomonas coronafaciens]